MPGESEVAGAEQAKEATEHAQQQTLIATNRERQEIDAARWHRRRDAERSAPAKGH